MSLSFELLRPEDLLALRVDAMNLKLDVSDVNNPKLRVENKTLPAFLVIQFPPQSINEKAYFETAANVPDSSQPPQSNDDPLDPPGSVSSRMAGGSRLVFRLPKSLQSISFRMDALLDWSQFELVLSSTALGKPQAPPIVAPAALETSLEIPYRLVLSPASPVAWTHAVNPAVHAGRAELWHTRVGKWVKTGAATGTKQIFQEASLEHTVPLRAIWSPDFTDHGDWPPPSSYLTAMSPRDRAELVILTSGTSGYFVEDKNHQVSNFVPTPIDANRLFLSSLGGWLSSRGHWPAQPFYNPSSGGERIALDISEWVHLATQARDHYVRIVYEGFLYPFGHKAALIKVTERKVVPADGGVVPYPTAYLKQHMYVVVREKEKLYGSSPFQHQRREMPFWQSVRVDTLVTPDIDKPNPIPNGSANPGSFWIEVGNAGFPFHITATDLAGKSVNFLAQLIFMPESEPNLTVVKSAYLNPSNQRLCTLTGQKVAYADPNVGDTTLKTNGLFFDTQLLQSTPVILPHPIVVGPLKTGKAGILKQLLGSDGPPYPDAPFLPFLDQAIVSVPALEQILGTSSPVTIQLYGNYLSDNLDPHAGVFAQISGTPPAIQFSADRSGGFATPNLSLTALSARKGLVAGNPDDAANGLIRPSEFFGDLSARLFGTVPLQALIPVDGSGAANADQNAPLIKNSLKPNAKNPDTLVTQVLWSPQLQKYEKDPVHVEFNTNGQTSALTLNAKLTRSLKGAPAESDIKGQLTNFMVTLLGVVGISFNALNFSSKNGQKLKVKADLPSKDPIAFIGPLEFVQTLADILPPGIFGGKGPSIDLMPDRIRVTYTLGLPPISIGVFAIEHISIMTGLDLPYLDGKPAFEFAFAKRNSPFLILVECLGGGGFVHLVVDTDGVQMVEGALEFGGEFSLDLGVASGGVHIFAGIYFKLSGTDSDLTGFVDVGGEVSVLGIISISLDLNLSLSYQVSNGKKTVQGRATLTVSVHVLFFSASVQISMEKSFGSSPGDPRVDSVLTAGDWAAYAGAFA